MNGPLRIRQAETEVGAALGAIGVMQYQCARNSVCKCLGKIWKGVSGRREESTELSWEVMMK